VDVLEATPTTSISSRAAMIRLPSAHTPPSHLAAFGLPPVGHQHVSDKRMDLGTTSKSIQDANAALIRVAPQVTSRAPTEEPARHRFVSRDQLLTNRATNYSSRNE